MKKPNQVVSLLLSGGLLLAAVLPGQAMAKGPVSRDKPLAKNIIIMIRAEARGRFSCFRSMRTVPVLPARASGKPVSG